jgi:hypothetical protein
MATPISDGDAMPWWKEPSKDQWTAYVAGWLGWTFDAFNFTIFPTDHGGDCQRVPRPSDRCRGGVHHHPVDAPGRWGAETESEWTLLLLIAIYIGFRLGEAPGLLRADLAEHEGVWSINVQSNRYCRLKTAPRRAPLAGSPRLAASTARVEGP